MSTHAHKRSVLCTVFLLFSFLVLFFYRSKNGHTCNDSLFVKCMPFRWLQTTVPFVRDFFVSLNAASNFVVQRYFISVILNWRAKFKFSFAIATGSVAQRWARLPCAAKCVYAIANRMITKRMVTLCVFVRRKKKESTINIRGIVYGVVYVGEFRTFKVFTDLWSICWANSFFFLFEATKNEEFFYLPSLCDRCWLVHFIASASVIFYGLWSKNVVITTTYTLNASFFLYGNRFTWLSKDERCKWKHNFVVLNAYASDQCISSECCVLWISLLLLFARWLRVFILVFLLSRYVNVCGLCLLDSKNSTEVEFAILVFFSVCVSVSWLLTADTLPTGYSLCA